MPLTEAQLKRLIQTGDSDTIQQVNDYLDALQAERCRASFKDFVNTFWPLVSTTPLQQGFYLDALCDHLQQLPKLKRLIINIPPRHGKSTLVCVLYPAWVWSSKPQIKFLASSYSLKLSLRDSVYCRQVIESPLYRRSFGGCYALTKDQNQKGRYETNRLGFRLATSVDSGNTGEGADILLADDLNDVAKAASQADRQNVIAWWQQVMSTRMNPGGLDCKVVIQQRCHEDDITGHILANDDKQDWVKLVLPWHYEPSRRTVTPIWSDPRTEPGQPLSTLYSDGKIAELQSGNGLGPTGFATQFEQRPSPEAGNVFKKDWFRRFAELPDAYLLGEERIDKAWCRRFITTDLAISLKTSADYTVAQAWAITPHGHLLLLDQFRDRVEGPDTVKAFKAMCERHNPIDGLWVEDVAFQRLMLQLLRQHNLPVKPLQTMGVDKLARSPRAQCKGESGMIWLPPDKPWVNDWIEEVTQFPLARHDDQADCLFWAGIVSGRYSVKPLPTPLTEQDKKQAEILRYNRAMTAGL